MKKLIVILLIIITCNQLQGQIISAHANTDKPSYSIGDYISVDITISGPASFKYYFPDETTISTYDIISSMPLDTQRSDDRVILTKHIIYSIYEGGDVYFPQVAINYQSTSDTAQHQILTDSIPLHIEAIAVDTTLAIKPIKSVLDVTLRNHKWILWLGIITGLIIIGGLIWYFFLRRKNIGPIAVPVPLKSLHERMTERLQQLQSKQLWQKGQLKTYYSELTDILRDYLEERYHMHAHESTSDEIVEQLERHPDTRAHASNIRYLLNLADMAKFAKSQPLADENTRAFDHVLNFIEQTREIITETPKQE